MHKQESSLPLSIQLPFVGREKELRLIREAFNSSLEHQGVFLLVQGEPGIGKTKLAEEFIRSIGFEDAIVIKGHGMEKEISPNRLISEMIRFYLQSINYDIKSLVHLLDDHMIFNLQKITPELKAYLPFDSSQISVRPLPPPEEKQRFYDSLLIFFSKLSCKKPLIVVIEDLHWLESESLDLLRYLIDNLRNQPVLFLGTSREFRDGTLIQAWSQNLAERRFVKFMILDNLNQDEISRMVEKAFDPKLTEELSAWLKDYTGGNPLFLHETLMTMVEQRIIRLNAADSTWRIQGDLSKSIPESPSVKSVIQRRLEFLDKENFRLLSLASILGDKFEVELLQRLSRTSGSELAARIDDLISRGLIEKIEKSKFRFAHYLVRQHIYESLDLLHREMMHHKIAGIIEADCLKDRERLCARAEELAYHFTHGMKGPLAFKKSIDYLTQAGLKAQKENAWEKAKEYFLEAAELLKTKAGKRIQYKKLLQLYDQVGETEMNLGRPSEAITYYKRALEIGKKRNVLKKIENCEILRRIGYAYHVKNEYDEALSYYRAALRKLSRITEDDEKKEYVKICNFIGSTCYIQGNYHECTDWTNKGLRLLGEKRDPDLIGHGCTNLAMVAESQGDYHKAIQLFQKSLKIKEKLKDRYALYAAYARLGVTFFHLGDYEKARENYYRSLRIAEHTKNSIGMGLLYNNLGTIYEENGEWEESQRFYRKALAIREKLDDRRGLVSSKANLGTIFLYQNKWDEALVCLKESQRLCSHIGIKPIMPFIQVNLAEAYLGKNRLSDAEKEIESALQGASELSLMPAKAEAMKCLAKIHSARKEWKKAEELFLEAIDIFEKLNSPAESAKTLCEYGLSLGRYMKESEASRREKLRGKCFKIYQRAIEFYAQREFDGRLRFLTEQIKANDLDKELDQILKSAHKAIQKIEREKAEKAEELVVATPEREKDRLRIFCFGRFRATRPGQFEELTPKQWGSVKAKQILAYLVTHDPKGIGVTKDRLIGAVWPEIDPATLENTFHVTLSYLRKAVETEKTGYVTHVGSVYRLNWEAGVWSDFHQFQLHLKNGISFEKEGKIHKADIEFQKAADLYQGDLLEDFYERWAEDLRDRFREKFREVFLRLAHIAWRKQDFERCISYCQRLLLSDPADEDAHRLVMLCYNFLGSRTSAVRQFKVCENNLRKYLELEPSPQTISLYQKIKQGQIKDLRSLPINS